MIIIMIMLTIIVMMMMITIIIIIIIVIIISNGNRTEWSPIRSVIMRVINKIGRPRSESPICFNNHEYDYYRPNWTTRRDRKSVV